jgi:hypothetical protein
VNLNQGYNIVTVAVGGVGTVNLAHNVNPFSVDLVDGDGALTSVLIQRI